jgi:hypothetical protein
MMKIIKINFIFLAVCILGLYACGKSEDGITDKEPTQIPAQAQGILPENGEPCADIEAVSGEPLKVAVHFQWTAVEFAETYELRVLEAQNEVYNDTFTSLEVTVTLDRGKSYFWSITAKNEYGETESNTFSFTTPGEAIGNYVPYAAVISVAFNTTTSEMEVSWVGNDEDGDTLLYDVVVQKEETLLFEATNTAENFLNSIPFIPSATYSIAVISKDNFGNFSIANHTSTAPN